MSRRRTWIVCLVLASMASVWAGWWVVSGWRHEAGMARVRRWMDKENRFDESRRWLAQVPSRWSNDPEVLYRLGVCEHAKGEIQAALTTWSRAGTDGQSPFVVRAGLARARTLVGDLGRFSDGESLLEAILRHPGDRDEVRHTLSELYYWEGRRDMVRRLIEDGWRSATDPIGELRNHWRADSAVILVEVIRAEVEHAANLAPDDDRVWLAQARLAMQDGRFDVAATWLDRCLKRRPEDPAVWRARLDRARAVDDLAEARTAVAHLPADLFTEDERLDLRAWFASHRGDAPTERRSLERMIAIAPGETRAFDRLATMSWDAGEKDRAREYRRRKSELDAAKDRYRYLIDGKITPSLFAELASLSESLGRRFEASGWWTLRSAFAPADRPAREALARLRRPSETPPLDAGVRLADILSDVDPDLKAVATPTPASVPKTMAAVPRFTDDAEQAGLQFVYDNGRSPLRMIPETTGGGVGLLDYDGDGWLDVYVVQGGVFPPRPDRPSSGDRLFRNLGNGRFEDASERSGIARMSSGFGHGVTVGDIDNDGRPDLFLTRWRGYVLYRNRGDGTFEDITERAGLGGDRDWPTSAAFADLDNDGDLDLYVCHYLPFDAEHPLLCNRVTTAAASERSEPNQRYNYCTPRLFAALPDHLFRNDNGRFVDVSAEAGIVDKDGRGLGVVAADVDDDGLVDLFVANDTTANYLWHNLGGMKFEELGTSNGVACNAGGAFQAGMGTACGDLDGDGRIDLLVTNFYGESTTFFRNLGGGMFGDETVAIGLAGPSRFLLGFGIVLFDANNDGHLDLATADGHVNDDRPDYPYDMPTLLMLGGEDGRLTDATAASGVPWTIPRVSRGLAAGDLDNDGRVDTILLPQQSPLAFFHNRSTPAHFITFGLEGTKSNRDGVGAVVTVKAGGREHRVWRYGGGSFQSASDPRLHIGLGTVGRVDAVEVRWPSGQVDRHKSLEVDRAYKLREGAPAPVPLQATGRRIDETKVTP
jgi:tetratricopeptide (TPR) repeat protein